MGELLFGTAEERGEWQLQRQHLLSAKGREELQLQLLFVHEGPLRATKDHEELQLQLLFVHEEPLRATEEHGERQLQWQHLLSAKGREGARRGAKNCNFFLSTKGR